MTKRLGRTLFFLFVFESFAQNAIAQQCPQNEQSALCRDAERADSWAQGQLGESYWLGQDYKHALQWFQLAAPHGDANAQYWLGTMYEDGNGVIQDYAEAGMWFRKAAEQGHKGAQMWLGVMYRRGEGFKVNYVLAHMWFNISGSRTLRDSTAERMTAEQISQAQALA